MKMRSTGILHPVKADALIIGKVMTIHWQESSKLTTCADRNRSAQVFWMRMIRKGNMTDRSFTASNLYYLALKMVCKIYEQGVL